MKRLFQVIIVFVLFAAVFSLGSFVYSEIPHLISYQGRITDSTGVPLEGAHTLVFRMYPVSAGGTALWNETHQNVFFEKGVFSVLLGSYVNLDLPFNNQYYLEIQVDGEIFGSRQKISSAAYALRAETADAAETASSADISNKAVGDKNVFDGSQKVGIGTVAPSADLEVQGTVKMFGAWQQKAYNTVYRADTDGFVVGAGPADAQLYGYSDAGNPPTTERARQRSGYVPGSSIIFPVKKGDYWKVTGCTLYVYWIPFGS